jgi:glycosyltransferase involved in cell wall biosynthesis
MNSDRRLVQGAAPQGATLAKVDIVVPCYNYARFLEQCVRSVLDQSHDDLRVLIIDDASSDDTKTVAQDLAQRDTRVNFIVHRENQGHIRTFNEGIAWASADYFLLLSADDLLMPCALERALSIMNKNPDVVLTHGDYAVWHSDGNTIEVSTEPSFEWRRQNLIEEMCRTGINFVATPTAIVRTGAQKAAGGYRLHLHHSGDMEMWLRLAALGAVVEIDAVQAIYRKHSGAMSNAYYGLAIAADYLQRKAAFESFFNEYGSIVADSERLREVSTRNLGEQGCQSAVRLLRRGHISSGLALLRWSMRMNPRMALRPPLAELLKMPGAEGRRWARQGLKRSLGRAGAPHDDGASKGFAG